MYVESSTASSEFTQNYQAIAQSIIHVLGKLKGGQENINKIKHDLVDSFCMI